MIGTLAFFIGAVSAVTSLPAANMWDVAGDPLEDVMRDFEEYKAGRRRLQAEDISEEERKYWVVNANFDPTRLSKVAAKVLIEWGKRQDQTSGQVSAIGKIAADAFVTLNKIETHMEDIFNELKADYGNRMLIEFENLRDRFIIATEELWSAEIKAMEVIRACIRMTYTSWHTLYQTRKSPDESFHRIATQIQRTMDAELQNMLQMLNQMIELIDFALRGRPGAPGSGFEKLKVLFRELNGDIQRELGKSADEMAKILADFERRRKKYALLIEAGNWSLFALPLTGGVPIVSMVLWGVAKADRPNDEKIAELRRKIDAIKDAQGLLNSGYDELAVHNDDLRAHGTELEGFVGRQRDLMRGLAGIISSSHTSHENIQAWRFAIPNKMCITLKEMHKSYNDRIAKYDKWDPLDKKLGSCDINLDEVFPPTLAPTLYDELTACLTKCGGELALEAGTPFNEFCLKSKCAGIKSLPPTPPPTKPLRSQACKDLAELTESYICDLEGRAYIILAAGDDNYSEVQPGNHASCLPKSGTKKARKAARTTRSGLRVVTVEKKKNGAVYVLVDANDANPAFQVTIGGEMVPYGTAGDCYRTGSTCEPGSFSINLSNTGFSIEKFTKWNPVKASGSDNPSVDVNISGDRLRVTGKCGGGMLAKGQCSGCAFDNTKNPFDIKGQRLLRLKLDKSVKFDDLLPECIEKDVSFHSRVHDIGPRPDPDVDPAGFIAWEADGPCCDFRGIETPEECNAKAHYWQSKISLTKCDESSRVNGVCPLYWTHSKAMDNSCQLFLQKGQPYWARPTEQVTSGSTRCYKNHLTRDEGPQIRCDLDFAEDKDIGIESLRHLSCAQRRWIPLENYNDHGRCGTDYLVGMCTGTGRKDCYNRLTENEKGEGGTYVPKMALCQKSGTGVFQRGDYRPKRPTGAAVSVAVTDPGKKAECNYKEGFAAVGMCSSGGARDCKCITPECSDEKKKYSHVITCQKGPAFKVPYQRKIITGIEGDVLSCDPGFVMYSMCSSLDDAKCVHNEKKVFQYIECIKVVHPLSVDKSYTITEIHGHWHRIAIAHQPEKRIVETVTTSIGTELAQEEAHRFDVSDSIKIGVSYESRTTVGPPVAQQEVAVTGTIDRSLTASLGWTRSMRSSTSQSLERSKATWTTVQCPKSDKIQCMYQWRQETTLANGMPGPLVELNYVLCAPGCETIPICHPDDCEDREKCDVCKSDDIIQWSDEDGSQSRGEVVQAASHSLTAQWLVGGFLSAGLCAAIAARLGRKASEYEEISDEMEI